MACNITSFVRDCDSDNGSGGVFNIWIAKKSDVASVTVAANVVTAITMVATKKFYAMGFRPETGGFTEVLQDKSTSNANVWLQTLVATLSAHTADAREFLEGLADCNCGLVIVHEEDQNQWIWGLGDLVTANPIRGSFAKAIAAENNSGVALTDPSESKVTLSCRASRQAMTCTQDMSALV